MNTRVLPHAVSLVLLFSAARAEDVVTTLVAPPESVVELTFDAPEVKPEVSDCTGMVAPEVTEFTGVIEDVGIGAVVTGEEVIPEVIVCPGVDDIPQIVVCPGVDETIGEEMVKVTEITPEMVQRGGVDAVADGEVDPSLVYATGGVLNFGGVGAGASGLEQGLAGSGLEAVAALKVEVADVVVAKGEVKVLASAGDVVISD